MASSTPEKAPVQCKVQIRDLNATIICSDALLFFSSFSYRFSDQSYASTQATAAPKKPYVVAAELPSPYLCEYTLNVGYTVKFVMEFVVSFTYFYLEDADKTNLGGNLGLIYGCIEFFTFFR